MNPLTIEQLNALTILKRRSGNKFRAISFSSQGIAIPKEWFMETFKPSECVQELFIDNPDKDELHVMRIKWDDEAFESVLNSQDYEKWIKQWEVQTNG